MAHPRTTIRAAVVSMIKFGGTAAGQRVYNSKTQTHEAGDLPNVTIFSSGGTTVDWRSMNTSYNRITHIRIECRVAHNSESSAASNLDSLCREVEILLHADKDLQSSALYSELGDTEINWNNDTDPPVLVAEISLNAHYIDDVAT